MLLTPPQPITLTTQLGKGGEATIYNIAEHSELVAKIYHNPTPAREAKLRAMLLNPPEQPATHVAIAWPVALLYKQDSRICSVRSPQFIGDMNMRQFVGFLMPKIVGNTAIFNAYNPAMRRQTYPHFNWYHLHTAAYNLVVATNAIHTIGHVIGDINESNILINSETLVTLVDTDSFQVIDERGEVYRCPVGKPEYTPPELQGVSLSQVNQTIEHDLFGLGVLIFQILMQGFHPFAGVLQSNLSVGRVDLYAIREGLFPYNSTPAIKPPPAAPAYHWLHPNVQQLFNACFVDGYDLPDLRPTARQWLQVLDEASQTLVRCPDNETHAYASHLMDCPWCIANSRHIYQPVSPSVTPITKRPYPDIATIPKNVTIHHEDGNLVVTYIWLADTYTLFGFFIVMMSRIFALIVPSLIFILFMPFIDSVIVYLIQFTGVLAITIIFAFRFFTELMNRTILSIDHGILKAHYYNPIWPINRNLPVKDIWQLYCSQRPKIVFSKQQGRIEYCVQVLTDNDIIPLVHCADYQTARYIELTIEQILNIPDQSVDGEYRPNKREVA